MRTVKDVVQGSIEDTTPQDEMMTWLRANVNGKKITSVHINKMRATLGDDTICLDKSLGMTHLERGNWTRSRGETGVRLLLAYCVVNVVIDCDRIATELSPSEFRGAKKRNDARAALMGADEDLCFELDIAIQAHNAAKAKLDKLMEDSRLQHVKYDIHRQLVDA